MESGLVASSGCSETFCASTSFRLAYTAINTFSLDVGGPCGCAGRENTSTMQAQMDLVAALQLQEVRQSQQMLSQNQQQANIENCDALADEYAITGVTLERDGENADRV